MLSMKHWPPEFFIQLTNSLAMLYSLLKKEKNIAFMTRFTVQHINKNGMYKVETLVSCD